MRLLTGAYGLMILMSMSSQAAELSKRFEAFIPFNQLLPSTQEYDHVKEIIMNPGPNCLSDGAYMHEIIPGLFLGSIEAARLHDLPDRIGTAVSLLSKQISAFSTIPMRTVMLKLTDGDGKHFMKRISHACDFIEAAQTPVLVHCRKGISRSASAVIAYLMKKFDIPFFTSL